MDGAGCGSDAGLLAGGSWERGRVGTGTQRGGGGGKRPPPPPVRDRRRMDGCLIFARDERGPWVCLSVFHKDQNGEQWEELGPPLPQPLVLPALAPARCCVQGWRQEPARVPPNGGLQSHGGALRGMQRPHWLTGGQSSLWPRPCLSGQADPAEEQRTQKTGSPAGRARVACKPLLSQKGERTLPPWGMCSGPHPSFFLEHEQPPGWGKSMTGA